MQDYVGYSPEDFARDDYFIRWVTFAEIETETFWQDWLETYPFKRADVELARQLVLIAGDLPEPQVSGQEIAAMRKGIFERIENQEEMPLPMRRIGWSWMAAAVVTLLMVVGSWYFLRQGTHSGKADRPMATAPAGDVLTEVTNQHDEPRLVNLPDGSSVMLKKGSTLSFPQTFAGDTREIRLNGEAFFEVAKDASKPFYVFANEVVTKVLGTSFTIRSFPTDRQVTVAVKTGKVSVFRSEGKVKGSNPAVVLVPNEQVVFEKSQQVFNKIPVNLKADSKRRIETMQFDYEDVQVGTILGHLEKAYGVKIVYDSTVIAGCSVTASFTDEPLAEKLALLCKVIKAEYQLSDSEITITGKGCK